MTIKSIKLGQVFSVGQCRYVKTGTYKVYSIEHKKVYRLCAAALTQSTNEISTQGS